MRSFLAWLAVVAAFLAGTVALGAYVVHDVVLAPARAGQVVDYALHQPETRREVLDKVVPGYGALPVRSRAQVDALADSGAVRRAARQVSLDLEGRVGLGPMQRTLAAQLRAAGQPRLAARVAAAGTRAAVPAQYVRRYQATRTDAAALAVRAALVTAVLVLLALLVSPRRLRTVRSLGVAAILAGVVVALLYWALPGILTAASSSPLVGAVVAVVQAQRGGVLLRVAPVAVVGLVLFVVGLAGRGRRLRT